MVVGNLFISGWWFKMKKKINKIVGVISDEIVEKYKLYEYRNETIV